WLLIAPVTTPPTNVDVAVYFVYPRILASSLMAFLIWQSDRPWVAILGLFWPSVGPWPGLGPLVVGWVLTIPEAALDWTATAKAAQIGAIQSRLMSRFRYVRPAE